jgi:hypothetical protein
VTAPIFTGLSLRVPWRIVSRNVKAAHWAPEAHRRRVRRLATALEVRSQLLHLRELHLDPRAPKRIRFCAHVGRLMDLDNLDTKPYLDGLRDAKVIHDDGPQTGHVIEAPTQVLDHAWRGLVITVEPFPPDPGGAA